jgi:hypothetical protein
MPGRKYDWENIRLEYIAGYQETDPNTGIKKHSYPSVMALSKKYGFNAQYGSQRAQAEKWFESRKYFLAKFREKATQDQFYAYISESASFDAKTIAKLNKLYLLVDAYLTQYEAVIGDEGTGDLSDLPEGIKISIKDILDLTNVLDKCQMLIRRTLGEPITNDTQFKSLVSDMMTATKKDTSMLEQGEAAIATLTNKRDTYKKAELSLEQEIAQIRKELADSGTKL